MVTTYNLADVIMNPFWTGTAAVWDFWQIAAGSREQKVKTAMQWMPVAGVAHGLTQNKPQYVTLYQTPLTKTITEQKKTPEGAAFWKENVVFHTDITSPGVPSLPSLDEFMKYIPLIIVGVLAIVLLPKIIDLFGGKK